MSPRRQDDLLDALFNDAAAFRLENPHIRGLRHREPVSIITSLAAVLSSSAAAVTGALGFGGAALGLGGTVGAAAGGLGGAIGAAAVGTGFSLGAFGSLGLSLGLSFAANAIQRAAMKQNQNVNSNEVRLNTRQSIPPRRRVYGAPRIGGALFFEEEKSPKFYRGFLLSDGPVEGPLEFYNSANKISVNLSTGEVLDAPYAGKLKFSFRNGTRTQAIDPILAAEFPELGAEFRQRGVATLVVEADWGADLDEYQLLWGSLGRPNPTLIMRGVPVYDPRDPTQFLPADPDDPDELAAAQASWKWTDTAALIQADYLWWRDGGRVPLHRMKWDDIAESASWDEGILKTKDGELIKRHVIHGVVTAGQSPLQNIGTMLTANRGFVARKGGLVTVISSQPQKPVFTITDDMVQGGFDFKRGPSKDETVNSMQLRMIDPRQEWQMVDGPLREDEDFIAEDGDIYTATTVLPWTPDHRRAQRLQWCALQDTRDGRAQSLSLDHRAIGLEAGDVVRRYSEVLPRCNGLYRVQEVRFNYVAKTLEISMAGYRPETETGYIAANDELDFELPELELS